MRGGLAGPRSTSRRAASRGSVGTWAIARLRQLVVEVGNVHGQSADGSAELGQCLQRRAGEDAGAERDGALIDVEVAGVDVDGRCTGGPARPSRK